MSRGTDGLPYARLPSGRFPPGVSGNPLGRPVLPAEFRETVTRLAASSSTLLAQLLDGEVEAPIALRARVALGLLALAVSKAGEPLADPAPPVVVVQAAEPVDPEAWQAAAALLLELPGVATGAEGRSVLDGAALLGWIEAGDLATAADVAGVPWDSASRQLLWGWRPAVRRDSGTDQG